MALRYRPMRPKDVRACVEIVAAHPLLGPQYESVIVDLPSVWLGLLGREAFRAVVFEDAEDSQVQRIGVGVSVFVSDDFLMELKTPPFFWIGPELTKRLLRGDSPLLSDKQVRQANANGGLNLLTWVGALAAAYLKSVEGIATMVTAFVEAHRGFLLKEITAHSMSLENLEGAIRSGGLFFNPDEGRYVESVNKPLHEVFAAPHLIGLTRELAMARVGTWIGTLFVYQSPQFSFRPSEQRLLLAALQGGTDQDLADVLGISLSAVKKTWRLIYDRVAARSPGLIPDHAAEELTSERGKEKKQRLLAYLREHPEELRPATL
jgi:DNA-binding CsgD family transcriptional regulator